MGSEIRVLQVDDDPAFAELAVELLERADDDLRVVTAHSADAGLDRLRREDVDCVVSDFDMPGADGLEFLRAVREDHPDLPFVLFTGKGSEEIASEAISAGVTDYLEKGSRMDRFDVLANRIRNAVARQRAERAAAQTERRLREIAGRSNDILWMMAADWEEVLFVNDAYEEIVGRPIEALRADPADFLEGVHPDDRVAVSEAMERLSSGEAVEIEYRVNDAEGYGRWLWVNAEPVFDADGSVARIIGFGRDVTERKERERRLEALHASTRRLLSATTREELAQRASDAMRDTLGYPFNVVRLLQGDQLVPVAISDMMQPALGGNRPVYDVGQETAGLAFVRGETLVYDDLKTLDDDIDRGETRGGMYVPIGEHGVVTIAADEPGVFDASDVHLAEIMVANVEAVMDLIDQRSALTRQNERLDAFADVLSHDLRNPLNVASGRVELARDEHESDDLERAARALRRMSALIDDVLSLAKEGRAATEIEWVGLRPVVETAWRMSGDGGDLAVEGDLGRVRADEQLLSQFLENLFANAVAHGGPSVGVGPLPDGFYVEDDGPGIPAEERERVFDTGFSTAVDGNGLGLRIVEEIADIHDWSLAVTSSEAGGARFEVTDVERVD